MRTRKEAVELVELQLGIADSEAQKVKAENMIWHYGRVELRELLDFIYEGKPASEEEEIS